MRTVILIGLVVTGTGCAPQAGSQYQRLADRELAAAGIDSSRFQPKILVGEKRVIIDYEDATPSVMEGQPIVVLDRSNGNVIMVHVEQ